VKRTPVLLMPAAERDLEAQADYIAVSGDPRSGDRLFQALHETLDLLSRHPRIGRVAEVRGRLVVGSQMLRIRGFPNHLVFYRASKRGVEVLRVVHGARDIESLFDE
jgi:toxin ParE1/3/4